MEPTRTKAVVSMSGMASMVGLSRARFYQLVGTTFPWPIYDVATRRPFYPEELQEVCLEVRRRNCGIDGKPVLFYSRRPATTVHVRQPNKAKPLKDDRHADLIDGLNALGLVNVTVAQVAEAVKQLYPQGMPGSVDGEVLRAVFLHLKRRDSGDNVGK
jgi:hypothetical protein